MSPESASKQERHMVRRILQLKVDYEEGKPQALYASANNDILLLHAFSLPNCADSILFLTLKGKFCKIANRTTLCLEQRKYLHILLFNQSELNLIGTTYNMHKINS